MRLHADEGEPRTNFGDIIDVHERIKAYTNREKGSLPSDEEMIEFGGKLFETLLQGDVRRLYDEGVVVRDIPGFGWLRVSCGWWTSDEDLDRLVGALS